MTSANVLAVGHLVLDAPPLSPDQPTARQWLQTELDQPIYQDQESLFSRFLRWITEWLDNLQVGSIPEWGPVILVALVLALVVGALVWAGPLRRARALKKESAQVFDDVGTTAAQFRELAAARAATGDYSGAVVNLFRALVRGAEERVIISEQPGRTALEAAHALGAALPAHGPAMEAAANTFDEVSYGDHVATAANYAFFADLDAQLQRARTPRLAAVSASGPDHGGGELP